MTNIPSLFLKAKLLPGKAGEQPSFKISKEQITQPKTKLFCHCLLYSNCNSNGHTNHRVVAGADEAHHVYMGRYGGGTSELCITMHTAEGIGHTIGSRAGSHVIWMQGTASAAAGSYGEVLLALLDALLLVGTSYWMLEAGRVGGVTSNGNTNILLVHDSNTFWHGVSTIAVYLGTRAIGVSYALNFLNLASLVVVLSLNIGEAVDTGDNLSSILAEAVQDYTERLLANLVCSLSDTDSTLSSSKGLVAGQECEAGILLGEQHSSQVAMAETYLAVVSNGTRYAESLQAFADSLGSLYSSGAALLDSDSCTQGVCPLCVLEADWLQVSYDSSRVKALLLADVSSCLNRWNVVFLTNFVDTVNTALIAFK